MRRITFIFICLLFATISQVRADEGMWLPNKIAKLNYADMQKLGCKLTAEEIYSINNSSLKDAIFQLQSPEGSGFCTGEIVSNQGLLFTNHHCGYEAIASLSSTEHNYLDDGFWAKNLNEEISAPGIRVTRVVRIEDVTSKVLEGIDEKTNEDERNKLISSRIGEIESKATEGNQYEAAISEMYQGGEYYLFVYEAFGDVRLVGTPPSAIGKFGGDTDNWMWPRHTGDFSIFRVYMSPDGKPTKSYDENNIPYKPLHSLPISIKGVNEGDFTMIMGFPGQTERYLSSYGMTYKRDFFNPAIVSLLDTMLKTQKVEMDANTEIRLKYSNTYAGNANGRKLFDGENQTLKTTDAILQKKNIENEFQKWVNADNNRKEKYGKVLSELEENYKTMGPITKDLLYTSLGLIQGSEMLMNVQIFAPLAKLLLQDLKENRDAIATRAESLKSHTGEMFKDYYPEVDKKVFSAMLKRYINDVEEEKYNEVFTNFIFAEYKAKTNAESIDNFINAVFEKSIFTSEERMLKFLDKPSDKVYYHDPLVLYFDYIMSGIMSAQVAYQTAGTAINTNERLFIEGLREFQTEKTFYPDANSTLRFTYGTVKSYDPADGVHYKYLTYADGILAKEDPTNSEFAVPAELKEKVLKNDYGRYADETGKLPVCFLSDNDITGGNSGSPILNGEGHLIGLAFDGNWEWLCSNLIFSKELQRTINVDSRYVLWVIDELYDCQHIMKELDIRE